MWLFSRPSFFLLAGHINLLEVTRTKMKIVGAEDMFEFHQTSSLV
jgi:hypothetical protein